MLLPALLLITSGIARAQDALLIRRQMNSWMDSVKTYSFYDSARMFRYGNRLLKKSKELKLPGVEIETTILFGNFYYYQARYGKALDYYKKASALSDALNSEHYKALSMIKVAYVELEISNYDLCKQIFTGVYEKSRERGDTLAMVEALNGIGILNENLNNLERAILSYKMAVKLAEGARLNYEQAYVKHNLGNLYFFQGEDSLGYSYLFQALRFAELAGHKKLQTHANLNIGSYYKKKGDLATAEMHYRRALHQARIDNSPPDLIPTILNLVEVEIIKKDYGEAEQLCLEALDISHRANLKEYLAMVYFGLARIKSETRNLKGAIDFTKQGLALALKEGKSEFINEGYSLLAAYYEQSGDYKNALNYFKEFKKLSDSLNNDNFVSRIKYLNSQEESLEKKQEAEKEKNKRLLAEQRYDQQVANQRLIFVSGIGLVLLTLLAFVIFYSRMRRRTIKQHRKTLIEMNDKERSSMALNLHDEVGQILSLLKNKQARLSASQPQNTSMLEIGELVDDAIEKTRNIAFRFHPKFLEHVSLTDAINSRLDQVEKQTGMVCLFEKVDDFNALSLIERVHIYRIVQECVSNTIKHAAATSIRIDFQRNGSRYLIIYRDNGRGLDKNFEKRFGFLSLEERVAALNGRLSINRKSASFHIEILFPW